MKQKILIGTILLIILGIGICVFKEIIVSVNWQKKNVNEIIKNKSIAAEDSSDIENIYYISANGKSLDGKSPDNPMSLETANKMQFTTKDKILFKKGDIFFGQINFSINNIDDESLVYIGSYGEGEKPIISVSKIIDDVNSWEEYEKGNIYRVDLTDYSKFYGLRENDENSCNIGFWKDEKGNIYGNAKKNFSDLKNEEDFFCDGKYFYLKSSINPKTKYGKIFLSTKYDNIRVSNNTEIDGIRIEFSSSHAIAKRTYPIKNVYIHNCKISDIGGSFQYGLNGTSTTRYGNAIEFWCGASNVLIENNLITNVYDACITLQGTDGEFNDILIQNNILLNSCYPFELWASQNAKSMYNITICNNYVINQGKGWGQEVRKNPYNSANFVFYEFSQNVKIDIEIHNNYFINSLREYYILNSTKERLLKYTKIYCNKYFYIQNTFVLNDLKEDVESYLGQNKIDQNSTFKLLTDAQVQQISNPEILNSNDYNEIKIYYEELEKEFEYTELKQEIIEKYNNFLVSNETLLSPIKNINNNINSIIGRIEDMTLDTTNEASLKEIINIVYSVESNIIGANVNKNITITEMIKLINELNELAKNMDIIYSKVEISNAYNKNEIAENIQESQNYINSNKDLEIDNLVELSKIGNEISNKETTTYADYLYAITLSNWTDNILNTKIKDYIAQNPVTIEYSETNITNKSVKTTIKTNAEIQITNNSNSKEYVFNQNGSFTFEYTIKGQAKQITAKVTNIDKTSPIINGVVDGKLYTSKITPTITDENLDTIKLILNGEEVKNFKSGTTLTDEGFYTLTATDKAGNKTQISFQIMENNNQNYIIQDNIIKNISEQTIKSDFDNKLKLGITYKITRNEKEITSTDNIATGDILTTSAGDKYTLIVTGDLNKDGKLNLKDLVKMRKYFLDGNNLDENEILSADCNFDGKINLKDLVKMRLMLLNQDATK